MRFAAAVDDGSGNDAGVVGEETSDGNSFSEEVDIAVSVSCVSAGEDDNIIAGTGIVDGGLNVIEIVRPLLVNDDYFRYAGNGQKS